MKIEDQDKDVGDNVIETGKQKNIFKLKEIFKDWCLSSLFQFLTKLYQYENNFQRVLWIIIFVTFSFGTFWFFVVGIRDYLEFDVVSKIRVYNEETLAYPVVTFCGAFPFSSKISVEILKNFKSE